MNHFYKNIQGWFDYEDLYSKIVKDLSDGSHIVEIGSWKGKSTAFLAVEILNSRKNIKFDCIDTWKGSKEHGLSNDTEYNQLYDTFISNISPVKSICNPIRSTSIEAASLYKDLSLDFVYIDASHDYENVKLDIQSWYPKIKLGGIIAGHDYEPRWSGVVQAVNEAFKSKPFYIQNISWVHKKEHI